MQKVVVNLNVQDDEKAKKKVMMIAASILGVDKITVDVKGKKLTVVGSMDPIKVAEKLRKGYHATIETVGPAKPKHEPKKDEPKDKVLEVHHYPVCPRCYYCYP